MNTHPTTDREVTMPTNSFTVTVPFAENGDEAVRRVHARLPYGFTATGITRQVTTSEGRHRGYAVVVQQTGGDRDDCWVVLTSYGMSPSADLGSRWEQHLGASAR